MKKIVLAGLIGLLLFTACDNTKKAEPIIIAKTEDYVIRLNDINISSIKIKNVRSDVETIIIKDGIIKEFCSLLNGMKYKKTDEQWDMSHEAEIFIGGKTALKIGIGGRTVSVSRKVMLGDTVLEKGVYEVEELIDRHVEKFFEGTVLDPQYIEIPAKLTMPEEPSKVELSDRGSGKLNQYEVQTKLYDFVDLNISGEKFELVEISRVIDYDTIEKQRLEMLKNYRAIIIRYGEGNIKIDSENKYNEIISASNVTLIELAEKPGNYQLFTDRMIIDIKADEQFVKGFENVFNANQVVSKVLKPEEIKELFTENKPYYMEYISKNLGIESWYGIEPQGLEKQMLKTDNTGEPYEVLGFYNGFDLRLLFFKGDKFVDYIDFGGRQAGTEYRLEKAGDKIFIAGKTCRDYGTGVGRYSEDWYILNAQGKKLVVSFPYDDFLLSPSGGYTLMANSIKLKTNNDINLTVEYSVTKTYLLNLDNVDEYGQVSVESTKKVVFKWDDKKSAFVSEYILDERGMTEIPPENKDITQKCTVILKEKYKQLTEITDSIGKESDVNIKANRKKSLEYFLIDCEDCEEKSALLELLSKD